jgi:hypothetical protein
VNKKGGRRAVPIVVHSLPDGRKNPVSLSAPVLDECGNADNLPCAPELPRGWAEHLANTASAATEIPASDLDGQRFARILGLSGFTYNI